MPTEDDLVDRLRADKYMHEIARGTYVERVRPLSSEAADKIERLRAALEGLMPFCAEDFPENPSDWSRACVTDAYRAAFIEANKVLGRG